MQPAVEFLRFEIGVDADGEIEEIRSVEPDRRIAVDRRDDDVAELRAQLGERGAQVPLRLDVRTQTQVDCASCATASCPRSITTPTAFEPRTAPGLDNFRRNHDTLNSSSTICAQRSASVSTS